MPVVDRPVFGTPCWIDLMTSDADRSRSFYTQVFGWEADEPNPDFGGYFNFTRAGARIAGCMTSQPGEEPSDIWSLYLATDDAAKSVQAAEANGARVVVPPMAVGPFGTMAVLIDPTGANIGLWQPDQHQGFGVVAEANAPGWFELSTRDHDGALAFYRELCRLDTQVVSDDPAMRYSVLVHGGEQVAGIYDAANDLPEGAPSVWNVYLAVDDADDTVARAVALGATVVDEPEDTPWGRLATINDPNGAHLKLVAPNEAMPAR